MTVNVAYVEVSRKIGTQWLLILTFPGAVRKRSNLSSSRSLPLLSTVLCRLRDPLEKKPRLDLLHHVIVHLLCPSSAQHWHGNL